MRRWHEIVCLFLTLLVCVSAQSLQNAAQAPASASGFNLSEVIGNLTYRQDLCSGFQLPAPYSNTTFDTSFLGPYQSVVVGPDNYTYHRFGPLTPGVESNTTLVMLTGSSETSSVWTPDLLQLLAINREVITFDYPGVGAPSTMSSDQQTLDSISQSLLRFFSALGVSQPDLFGWSWGGTIALYLGAFYGDSIGDLVIADSTSGGAGYYEGLYLQSNASTPVNVLNTLLFPNTGSGEVGLCKLNAFEMIMPGPNLTSSELRNQSTVINSAWANNTLSQALGNITNPTLLISGELDVIIDFQSTLYLLENINSSVLLSDETAGNGAIFQDTANIVTEVIQFLDYYGDYDEEYEQDYESGTLPSG